MTINCNRLLNIWVYVIGIGRVVLRRVAIGKVVIMCNTSSRMSRMFASMNILSQFSHFFHRVFLLYVGQAISLLILNKQLKNVYIK